MKVEINCSQELLEQSKYCGTDKQQSQGCDEIPSNCWIALAVREVFPHSIVGDKRISLTFMKKNQCQIFLSLTMPESVQKIIKVFDHCDKAYQKAEVTAENRLTTLKPFTFQIELTIEQEKVLLENISLPDLTECFSKSKHLTLTA